MEMMQRGAKVHLVERICKVAGGIGAFMHLDKVTAANWGSHLVILIFVLRFCR